MLLVCLALFVLLLAWARLWPHTGEGDSIFHYLLARQAWVYPKVAVSAFARPVHKLLLVVPAHFGLPAARAASAFIAAILAWQTIRLAQDLQLRRALMAAPLLLLQPLTFALAADTMTELPAALGIVIAMRLWMRGSHATSCAVVSFLPLMRPEGFFLIAVWAAMVSLLHIRAWPASGRWGTHARRWLLELAALTPGILCWLLASRLFAAEWLYAYNNWNWPAGSYAAYGRGPIYHHAMLWPYYCGLALLPLFLLGLRPSMVRPMLLPWCVWLLVFGLHSLLFWRGAFASAGLMRIMATTAPVTALICLFGWNSLCDWATRRGLDPRRRQWIGAACIIAMLLSALGQDVLDFRRYHAFAVRRAACFIRFQHLLDAAPRFFAADPIVLAELDFPPELHNVVANAYSREQELAVLAALPAGTLGVWDNQKGLRWFKVAIEDLEPLGYTILYSTTQAAPDLPGLIRGRPWLAEQRFVVVRKDSVAR